MMHLRSALFAAALIVFTPPFALFSLCTWVLPRRSRYRIISLWSRSVVWLARWICGIRWRVEGLEHLPSRPAVILAKHQSAWETLAFQMIFPPQVYLLKRELLWIPFFGWGLALMSPIAIDRSRGRAALRQLAARGAERLAQGFWIVIFPEGTRTAPGTRRPYHPGIAALYGDLGVPVVPIALNTGLYWRRRGFTKRPGTAVVEFLAPIPAGLDRRAFMAELEDRIETASAQLLPETR